MQRQISSRNRYGEGSIYQDKQGYWRAKLYTPDGGTKFYYGKTKKEVREKLADAMGLLKDGLALPSNQPLGDYLEQWLNNEARKEAITDSSWVSYEGHIRLHITPALGAVRLSDLTPEHIDRLTGALVAKKLSAKTIRNIRVTLRAALEQARRRGHVVRNVVDLSEAPRVPRKDKRALTPEQVREVFQAVLTHRLAALWILDVATGLRKSELLGLRKADLDLQMHELHVLVQLRRNRITGELQTRELKTREGRRVIALPEGVMRVLEAHLTNQDRERELAGDGWLESGFLFTTDHGTPLDGDNILRTFQILIRKAGLPHLTMHDLRHANSSFMALLNVHPKVAQRQLGHSQISTTMDIYTHVADDSSREVAAKFNKLLFQTADATVDGVAYGFDLPEPDRANLELQSRMEGRSPAEIVCSALRWYLEAERRRREEWAANRSLEGGLD